MNFMDVSLIIIAYCLGCLNAGYYWVKYAIQADIRELGSCNAGAKNVGRILGAKGFALVFIWDALKGSLAVLLALQFSEFMYLPSLCGLAVVLGHIFPVQLNLRGGKGVATSFGVLLALFWAHKTDHLMLLIPVLLGLLLWTHRTNIRALGN